MRLKDKVCVITGAAQGIGEACAMRFANERAKVVVSDVQIEKGEAVAKAIRNAGGEAIFFACDVSQKSDCVDLIQAAVDAFGSVDVHLSNAAIIAAKEFLDITEEDWEETVGVNLNGFFYAGQAAQGHGGLQCRAHARFALGK